MSDTPALPIDVDDDPAIEIESDGAVIIDMSDGIVPDVEQDEISASFDANLADILDDATLTEIGSIIEDFVTQDRQSRQDWMDQQSKGMDLLGLKYEEKTQPWAGACGAFHPMLLESVLAFQAQATSEIMPPAGPAKFKIIGHATENKMRQGVRVAADLNHILMHQVPGYREDTKQMLFKVPIAGTIFRKVWYDEVRQVPRVQNIEPENFILPYSMHLDTAPRYTLVLPTSIEDVVKLQATGFYRDIDIGEPTNVEDGEIQETRDKIQGEDDPSPTERLERDLYECYAQLDIPGLPESDGTTKPFIVTMDSSSRQVLRICRNWREGDPTFKALQWGSQYTYMPGLSAYGTGLLQILGGLSQTATMILRQLVDAGSLANLPAGYKAKDLRIKGDNTPIMPGEWRDVESIGGTLRDSFFKLPYEEPSTVLHALLGNIVDEGRRLGATADAKISDIGSQQMPVGTALAILESVMKVMSGVMRNMHDAMATELKVMARIVRDYMPAQYPFELDPEERTANRWTDYDDRIDVLPVSNPNTATMAMRIMKTQAVLQLSSQAPQLYDQAALHKRMLIDMSVDDFEDLLPSTNEVKPRDPVTENMDMLNGKPVKASAEQDHEAHIAVHMAAAENPKILQLMERNPNSQAILAAASAHIQEHIAYQYRLEIEKALGVPLPAPDQPLPSDVEYNLASLTAAAAEKVLGRHQAEEQQREILDKMEDPVVQQRERELDIKEADLQRKAQETDRRLDLQERKQEQDVRSQDLDRTVDIAKTVLDANTEHGKNVSDEHVEGVRQGIDLAKFINSPKKGDEN